MVELKKKKELIVGATVLAGVTFGTDLNIDSVNADTVGNKESANLVDKNVEKTEKDLVAEKDAKLANMPTKEEAEKAASEKENVAGLKDAVNTAQNAVDKAETSVASAKTALTNAQNTAEKLNNQVKETQTQLDNLGSEKASLTTEQEDLKTKLANADKLDAQITEVNNNLTQANNAVTEKETALKTSNTALQTANQEATEKQASVNTLNESIAQQKQKIAELEKAGSTASPELEAAKNKLAELNSNLDTAQSALNDATQTLNDTPKNLPVSLPTVNVNYNGEVRTGYYVTPETLPDTLINEKGNFDYSQTDKWNKILIIADNTNDTSEKITQNLTKAQMLEATNYAITLMNSIRHHYGLPDLEVSDQTLALAVKEDSVWPADKSNGHYMYNPTEQDGFNGFVYQRAQNMGLNTWSKISGGGETSTMFKLKVQMFNILQLMAYADAPSDWGHRHNILLNANEGARTRRAATNQAGNKVVYTSYMVNKYGNGVYDFYVTDKDQMGSNLFAPYVTEQTGPENPAYAKAQAAVAQAQQQVTAAQDAINKQNEVIQNLEKQPNVTDPAQAAELEKAKQALADLNTQLEAANTALTQATEKVTAANNAVQTAQNALTQAKAQVTSLQGQAADLAKQKAELATIPETIKDNDAKLAALEAKVKELEATQQQTGEALLQANKDVEAKKAALTDAEKVLADASADLDAKKQELNVALDKVKAAGIEAQEKRDAIIKEYKQKIDKLQQYKLPQANPELKHDKLPGDGSSNEGKKHGNHVLPHTGDETIGVAAGLLGLLSAFGLTKFRKKR